MAACLGISLELGQKTHVFRIMDGRVGLNTPALEFV